MAGGRRTPRVAAGGGGYRRGGVPARLRRLHAALVGAAASSDSPVEMSFAELGRLIDGGLPPSAREPAQWWTNNPGRAHARAWLDAGLVASWDTDAERVVFEVAERETPPLDTLRHRRDQRARHAARALAAAAGDPDRRGSTPHRVYLVHLPDERQFKVGCSRVGSRRVDDMVSGWGAVLVEEHELSNRWQAEMVEVAVLQLVEPWHVLGDPYRPNSGYTERWSDTGPTIDLSNVAASVLGRPPSRATVPQPIPGARSDAIRMEPVTGVPVPTSPRR